MKNLDKYHNPYDFANPVDDEELFVGRKDELEEIRYYLDHAKTARRPINIALLGRRASGKTSFLNMTEIEARRRGFCTVRIDLDEGDSNSQLLFFQKLFDALFLSVCEYGAFGGLGGDIYNIYLDVVNTYVIPNGSFPFLFPLQFSKAISIGNISVQVSDHSLKRDILKIQQEVNRPIVLLFDEVNVLAKSRIHLEKIRNIFMNIPGFMLVFTGTPDLFPVMDDVFSPIVRQFKKINISGFKSIDETRKCILIPLKKAGIKIKEIYRQYDDIEYEIHNLSGGRPYEIQLICHTIFRRIQDKRAKMMRIDFGVLEDVRKELETSQDITIRPVLKKIKTLRKDQLVLLGILCKFEQSLTIDQVCALEYLLHDEMTFKEDEIREGLQFFVNLGVISVINNVIEFSGDDFDKIYTKYFAREQDVELNFHETLFIVAFQKVLISMLHEIDGINIESLLLPDMDFDVVEFTKKMSDKDDLSDIFVEYPIFAERIYEVMVDVQNNKNISIIKISISVTDMSIVLWYYSNIVGIDLEYLISNVLAPLVDRCHLINSDLLIDIIDVPVIEIETLAKKIEKTDNERVKLSLSSFHLNRMFEEYVVKKDIQSALLHARMSMRYYKFKFVSDINIGYLFFAAGDLEMARQLLETVIYGYKEKLGNKLDGKKSESESRKYIQDDGDSEDNDDGEDNDDFQDDINHYALANYNLGMVEARCGNIKEAVNRLDMCIDVIEGNDSNHRKCRCVFVANIVDGNLMFEEVDNPDILDVACRSKCVIETLFDV